MTLSTTSFEPFKPANLPAQTGRRAKRFIQHDVAPDPLEKGKLQVVARNRRTDVLDYAHACGWLNSKGDPKGDYAYAAGLSVQQAFELLRRDGLSGGGQWGEGGGRAPDSRMLTLVVNAQEANALIAELRAEIGRDAFEVVEMALSRRMTFAEITLQVRHRFNVAQRGSPRDHEVYHVRAMFRQALRALAERRLSGRGRGMRASR